MLSEDRAGERRLWPSGGACQRCGFGEAEAEAVERTVARFATPRIPRNRLPISKPVAESATRKLCTVLEIDRRTIETPRTTDGIRQRQSTARGWLAETHKTDVRARARGTGAHGTPHASR